MTLTGNTFWMGYTHNLLIEDCSNIVIGTNNFDRNPRYDYGDSLDARNSLVVRNSEDCTLVGPARHASVARARGPADRGLPPDEYHQLHDPGL